MALGKIVHTGGVRTRVAVMFVQANVELSCISVPSMGGLMMFVVSGDRS